MPQPDGPAGAPDRWRVRPALPGLKLAGAAGFVLLGLLFGTDPVRIVLAATTALALAAWAVRDLLVPVRLAADAAGITVATGYVGTRTVPWDRIERVRVDTRPRLGLRTETLEVDTGESLHLFSAYDLSAPPAEVAARLERLRRTRA
jgi:hypothetical protein